MQSDPTSTERLPERPEVLGRNWYALERCQPDLARRLATGAAEGHLSQDAAGRTQLSWRGASLALDLEGERRHGVPLELDRPGAGTSGETLLFGLGLGELLETALVRNAAPILAWERDPALLLATLSRLDVAGALDTGRLRLALGTDLLERCGGRRPASLRAHPILGSLYARELRLVQHGRRGVPVALAEGRLFVDQVGECLGRLGFDPFTVDLRQLSLDELDHQLRALAPRLLFEVNHLPGTPEFCAERGVPYVSWEIDPSTERVPPLARDVPQARVHTYRRAHVEPYRAAGFGHVEYAPLAADTETRQPALTAGERPEQYTVDLAFVGASMVARGRQCQAEFLAHYRAWAEREGVDAEGVEGIVESLLAEQRSDPFDYRLPARLREALGDFVEDHERRVAAGETHVRLDSLLGEVAAAEKRLNLVAGLGRFAPAVWGDDGWKAAEVHGARHRGGAGHTHELNRIYSGARINLDIGRLYQSDIVTMRVFDVLACGGFALVEHSTALEELFEVGVELDAYRSVDELHAKVEHWLAHPDERAAVAERGLKAVRERHTMQARLAQMLAFAAPPEPAPE